MLLLATLLAIAAGCAIAFAPRGDEALSESTLAIMLIAVSVAVAITSLRATWAQREGPPPMVRFGSGLLGLAMLLGVVVPGVLLTTGAEDPKLPDKGYPLADLSAEVAAAYAIFLLVFLAFVVGERLTAYVLARQRHPTPTRQLRVGIDTRGTYFALVGIGTAITLYSRVLDPSGRSQEEVFATRGQVEGAGAETLLGWSIPLGIALAVVHRHWGSRRLVTLNALLAIVLISQGTRSPFLLIGVAMLIRFVGSPSLRRRPARSISLAVVAGYLGVALAVGIADWRGDVIREPTASLSDSLIEATRSPLTGLGDAGLDSLDGLILARNADRAAVGASWTDLHKAITGFIPHQIWPEKPEWLSVVVTHHYIHFGGSGIFMSGAGYGLLLFGGTEGAILLFLVLGAISAIVYRRLSADSLLTVLWTYFLLRFFFAGDAFDAFHVLGLLLLSVFASGLATVLPVARDRDRPEPVPRALAT